MHTDHYNRVARWLHWAMALLIIGNMIGGLAHDIAPATIIPLHKASGILILTLALIRFGWRLTHRPPPLPAEMARWEKAASHLTHLGFYALMIVVPLTGWIMSSASDYPISFFGLFDVPKFDVVRDSPLADAAHEGHELLAFAMIGLLLLHIVAALRHHLVLKDGIMRRMLG